MADQYYNNHPERVMHSTLTDEQMTVFMTRLCSVVRLPLTEIEIRNDGLIVTTHPVMKATVEQLEMSLG